MYHVINWLSNSVFILKKLDNDKRVLKLALEYYFFSSFFHVLLVVLVMNSKTKKKRNRFVFVFPFTIFFLFLNLTDKKKNQQK